MHSKASLSPYILNYKASRALHINPKKPISITCSVTNRCNSRCLTCNIWKIYSEKPELQKNELKVEEFNKIFQSLGKSPYWFTMSGGEPFLREDLDYICESAYDNCRPAIINIPTNGILTNTITNTTRKILEACPKTSVVINMSLDGVDAKHDEIRRVPGNFNKSLETFQKLRNLRSEFPNLELGIHSVVSKFSINHLLETYAFAKSLNPDSFITEVAEERSELFTKNTGIAPEPKEYERSINHLLEMMKKEAPTSAKKVSSTTRAFRLIYYRIATQVLREKRQIIPCYAGYASCQITPMGDIWPCCVLGYDATMGNLRTVEYDFNKVWCSEKAQQIRKSIFKGECYCPLANAHYTSMICDFSTLFKVILNL